MDLIVPDMLGFDVILGIHWLATYYATFDCYLKMFKLDSSSEPSSVVQGDWSLAPYNLILAMSE